MLSRAKTTDLRKINFLGNVKVSILGAHAPRPVQMATVL
jgi:hypothetical protein